MTTLGADLAASVEATTMVVSAPDADAAELYAVDSETVRVIASEGTAWEVRRGIGSAIAAHSSGATLTPIYPRPAPGGGGGVTVTVPPAAPVAVTNITLPGGSISEGSATPGVIISDTEPEPGAGQFWLRQIDDGNSYQLYVRNAGDDAWMQASAGNGSGDYGDGFADAADRQVGYFNLDFGGLHGIEVQPLVARVRLRAISVDGNTSQQITLTATGLTLPGLLLTVQNLPTADPLVAGQFYTDGAPSANTPKALMVSGG